MSVKQGLSTRTSLRSIEERDALVKQWNGLPMYVWAKMKHISTVRRFGRDDAVAVGFLTLIRAAELWDSERGVKFNTYAISSIMKEVGKAANDSHLIHVPEYVFRSNAPDKHKHDGERARAVVPLPPTFCKESPAPESDAERAREAYSLLGELYSRDAHVIRRCVMQKAKLKEVSLELHVSKERVRQYRLRGIKKLKELMGVA